jgi:hypothetical protein
MSGLSNVAQLVGKPAREVRVVPALYRTLKHWTNEVGRHLKFSDHFQFQDRRRGSTTAVCMLVGYKPDLWPYVIPRFKRALPDTDVCLVSPGLRNEYLADLCCREGWSYLCTATNDVSLAQNLCYRLHTNAELIVKIDEDIFLLEDTISALVREHRLIKAKGVVDPGCVAPMIPINGFCYRHLLERLGWLDEYEARFGRARIAGSGIAIQNDPAAARWMWERTAPLEETARRLASIPPQILLCPIQFSIGVIVFERLFWETIGHLPVYRRRLLAGLSTLGADEEHICAKAVTSSRPIVVTTTSLAGHFSFGPQYAAMKSLIDSRPELFTR